MVACFFALFVFFSFGIFFVVLVRLAAGEEVILSSFSRDNNLKKPKDLWPKYSIQTTIVYKSIQYAFFIPVRLSASQPFSFSYQSVVFEFFDLNLPLFSLSTLAQGPVLTRSTNRKKLEGLNADCILSKKLERKILLRNALSKLVIT